MTDRSAKQAAKQLTAQGIKIKGSTLWMYSKSGVFRARKTPRGDLIYSDKEIRQLAKVIAARRASRNEALRRGRALALLARRPTRG